MLKLLNNYLLRCTFLVGEEIILADTMLICTLYHPHKSLFDLDFRKPYGNINRWFLTLTNQTQLKAVISEFILYEEKVEINSEKYAKNQIIFGKRGKNKKENQKLNTTRLRNKFNLRNNLEKSLRRNPKESRCSSCYVGRRT